MAWSDLADMALQAVRNTFGVSATYTPITGEDAFLITGVFTDKSVGVDPETGVPVSQTVPTFTIRAADFPTGTALPEEQGNHLLINGVTYSVVDAKPDGEGGITFYLND